MSDRMLEVEVENPPVDEAFEAVPSPRPVRRTGEGGNSRRARRIAVACDGSKNTLDAVQWTLTELVRPEDIIVLVHVMKPDNTRGNPDGSGKNLHRASSDPNLQENANVGRSQSAEDIPQAVDRNWSVPLTSPFSRSKRRQSEAARDKEASTVAAGWIILNRYQLMCREAGLTAVTVLVRGEPGSSFVDCVASQDCDLAVLGSRCLSALSRAVFSSVGTHVLQHMECPTIVHRSRKDKMSVMRAGSWTTPSGEARASSTSAISPKQRGMSLDRGRQSLDVDSKRSTEDAHLSSDSQTGDNTAAHSASEANTPSCPASPESRSASNPATPSLLSTPGNGASVSSRRRRRIGVGMDGSRGCVEALSWAIKNIYRRGDIIVLITCQPLQFIPGAGYGAGSTFVALEEKAKVKGNRLLEKYRATCESKGVRSAQIFARGDPGKELVEVAEAHHCMVIVVGAHGSTHDKRNNKKGIFSAIGSWLFGSGEEKNKIDGGNLGGVAFTVSHSVHTPVVVVRRQGKRGQASS